MGSPEKPIDVEMGDMSEEAKLHPKPDEIKENGDVKEERFTGLKKEDLLKIANQPKWVRARWALFIIFWIAWLAMLVGAILIVVNAPRCKPEPEPQWYQDTVVYELNAKEFAEGYEGVQNHLPYIVGTLHAKTILLTDAVIDENFTKFINLVNAVHEGKEPGYVVVDVVVDSLPTSSSEFIESASSNCADGNARVNCDLFIWKDGNETMEGWQYVDSRQASYKITDSNRAFINYSSENAWNFIKSVIQKWFERGVDGVKIRDLSKLHNVSDEFFVESLWEDDDLFRNHSSRALFVYSSSPKADINPVVLSFNGSNTVHSPVFLTAELPSVVNQNEAGYKMENIIKNWRDLSRNIGGYVVSPTGQDLAARRFGGFAAGLNLLSMSLPGVPILRSGDELAAMQPNFTWKEGNIRDSTPLTGSIEIMKQTKELIVSRVAGIQAKPSLRYDTRDNDTVFTFLSIGNKDIIAFIRKWDKKDQVLVVSNLSPNNHTVNLVTDNGLVNDNQPVKKAKIFVTSVPGMESPVDLEKLQLPSGTTLLLEKP